MNVTTAEQRTFAVVDTGAAPVATTNQLALAACFGLCAVVWFVFLSGWMRVTPGSVMTKRQNVLFNSDTNLWVDRMIGDARSPEHLVHPLEVPLWRYPCRALQHLLGTFLPVDYAGLLAARLFVALIAGTGVGCLAFLALRRGITLTQCVLLFTIYLLFTSNCTAALPEHFGISNGLLSITFVVPFLALSTQSMTIALAVLLVLCGGTTITNAAFPFASMFQYSLKSMRARKAVALATIPIGLGASLFVYMRSSTIHYFVSKYLNLRLFHDPLRAGVYAIYAVVCPAVGPTPRVLRWPGWDMVSYEPAHEVLRLSYYFGIQAIGAIAWLALLLTCVFRGLRDGKTRAYVWLPLGWVLFSAVFHNIWGDELFLYAPHWSWALMALVILGARGLSGRFIAVTFAPIVISQIYTLFAIKSALQTIVR